MKKPNDVRGDLYGVFQILITTKCDGGNCSNCTQYIPYRKNEDITLENFKKALSSIASYNGIIGIFGGNPCLHPEFDKITEYLTQVIPDKRRRGLWTNNINGHGELIQKSYGYFNFNVHGNHKHAEEMRRRVPSAKIWGLNKQSEHGAVAVDISDFIEDYDERQEIIEQCDINRRWSPAIMQINGELKGYFCEVAGAMDAVFNKNVGLEITKDWWKKDISYYQKQINECCHHCGVPLKLSGSIDKEQTDTLSRSTIHIAEKNNRKHIQIETTENKAKELTDYMGLRK